MPSGPRSTFGIVIAPEGATLDYTDRYMKEVEGALVRSSYPDGGFGARPDFSWASNCGEREKSQQQIVQEAFPQLLAIPGCFAFVINPRSLGGSFSSRYDFRVRPTRSNGPSARSSGRRGKLGYMVNLDTDLRLNKPQLDLTIDRERVPASGIGDGHRVERSGPCGHELERGTEAV